MMTSIQGTAFSWSSPNQLVEFEVRAEGRLFIKWKSIALT